MTTYYCNHCETFHDAAEMQVHEERMGEFWGSAAYQTFMACPCGSLDIEEAHQCSSCGDDKVLSHGFDVCDDCLKDYLSGSEVA